MSGEQKTFDHNVVEAPKPKTPIAFFWDFENASVPENYIEEFIEVVRGHMEGFSEKHFYAPASVGYINKHVTSVAKLNRCCVDICYMEAGKDKADNKIKDKVNEFFVEYRHDGWIVIITGDTGFYDTIIRYKRKYSYQNLVLIYDDRQESSKVKQMAKHAPRKIPLTHFLNPHFLEKKEAKEARKKARNANKKRNHEDDTQTIIDKTPENKDERNENQATKENKVKLVSGVNSDFTPRLSDSQASASKNVEGETSIISTPTTSDIQKQVRPMPAGSEQKSSNISTHSA